MKGGQKIHRSEQRLTAISLSPAVSDPSRAAGLPWTMAVIKMPFSRPIPLSEEKNAKIDLNATNTDAYGFRSG